MFARAPAPEPPADASTADADAAAQPPPAFADDDEDVAGTCRLRLNRISALIISAGEDDGGDDAVPRAGQKRKVEPGWDDATLDQRKSSMQSNPPPFDYRWDDATKEAVNVALAAYNGSHMCVASSSRVWHPPPSPPPLKAASCASAWHLITGLRYHNFTSGKTHSDASSLRFIESFKVRLQPACAAPRPILFVQVDSVFELDGVQFCSLVVHGQSFM